MKDRIFYLSTNRKMNTEKTSGFEEKVTFQEALFTGQAPDRGLFMPDIIPEMTKKEILRLKGKPYHVFAFEILKRFLAYEIQDQELKRITEETYTFDVPIDKLERYVWIVRLDRGPTASFKDFGARIMARLMYKLKPADKKITILVATSGDTGSAIGEAYKGLDRIQVYLLYPQSEVSSIQKKQLDSIGKNVHSIAVDGKFDDCQYMVKEAFADPELAKFNLTSANSINIARILPQIVYYFYSYLNVVNDFQPVVFSVPSGNFGNSLGCEMARRMGLPIEKIIIATNENDEFPEFLKSGIYQKIQPSRKCLSNAMNVGNPSNLARYFELYGGTMDKDGIIYKEADLAAMNEQLYSVSISDEETIETIRQVYQKYRIVIEPHGAVGIAALMKYFKENGERFSLCMETAHPAKFPEILIKELGIHPKPPDSLVRIIERDGKADSLSNDYQKFKDYIMSRG